LSSSDDGSEEESPKRVPTKTNRFFNTKRFRLNLDGDDDDEKATKKVNSESEDSTDKAFEDLIDVFEEE
jgi:hypothetical protein